MIGHQATYRTRLGARAHRYTEQFYEEDKSSWDSTWRRRAPTGTRASTRRRAGPEDRDRLARTSASSFDSTKSFDHFQQQGRRRVRHRALAACRRRILREHSSLDLFGAACWTRDRSRFGRPLRRDPQRAGPRTRDRVEIDAATEQDRRARRTNDESVVFIDGPERLQSKTNREEARCRKPRPTESVGRAVEQHDLNYFDYESLSSLLGIPARGDPARRLPSDALRVVLMGYRLRRASRHRQGSPRATDELRTHPAEAHRRRSKTKRARLSAASPMAQDGLRGFASRDDPHQASK